MVLMRRTSADVSCVCLQDDPAGAAAAADDAGAAESAAAGPAADPPVERPWQWEFAADWLRVRKGGKWGSYAEKFEGVSGEELCDMEKEDVLRFVDKDPRGGVIFNDIAKLKKPASSSSSEGSPGSASGTACPASRPPTACRFSRWS